MNLFKTDPFDVDQLSVADLEFINFVQKHKPKIIQNLPEQVPIQPRPSENQDSSRPLENQASIHPLEKQDPLDLVQIRILSPKSCQELHWYKTYSYLYQCYFNHRHRTKSQHSWMSRQREKKHLNKLTPEQVDLLEKLPGWNWRIPDKATQKNWVQKFLQLRDFLFKFEHWPDKPDPLYRWTQDQFRRWVVLNSDQQERLIFLNQLYPRLKK